MTSDTGIQEQLRDSGTERRSRARLAIVSSELMETIRNAHLALEDCVDGRGGSARWCAAASSCTRSAARCDDGDLRRRAARRGDGGRLQYVANLRPGKGREDGLEALTRSMVQLPIYIERLLGGGRDIALVLLPILNDLRAARGQPLLV